jgi:hypothetical protein
MKKLDRQKKEADETLDKIHALARHIRNVEDNCLYLGEKLIGRGEINLGKQLIANGYVHDTSKFYGIEFDNLSSSTSANTQEENAKLKMRMAIQHHTLTNKHHPEAWSQGIREMPDVYLAEMVCDLKARSEEFGNDLRQWINENTTKRFGFTKEDDVYKKIMEYVDLLCPKLFEKI